MYNLFSNTPTNAGYRVEYMEIFNWGTFDQNIYRISPKGNTSLLTGANGSGKTTYIDALLTLLVPIKKFRFYNRSSGTNKKNERTENSYVMGAIGDKQEEGKDYSKTIYLRPEKKSVYSILLAIFKNDRDHCVTLFQVRWFFNGELKRTYGIARSQLSIETDFYPMDPRGDWKKALKKRYPPKGVKENVMFFDTSVKYATKLIKLFGMRSEKALSLFNQTVGIKVLGNLDHFIRNNMLEPQNSEEEFIKLKENYDTLLDAHKQIEKADAQVKLLTPIRDLARQVEEITDNLKELEQFEETRDVYFNSRLIQLIAGEIEKEEHALEIAGQKKEGIEARLENRREEENSLLRAIENDETGKRLKDINQEIARNGKDFKKRKDKLKEYNALATRLQLSGTPDEPQFFRNIEHAKQQKKNIEKNAVEIESRKFFSGGGRFWLL